MRTAAALLLLASLAAAQHAVKELRCPPSVEYRIARDMNGDGLDDLLIVSGDEVWYWYGRRAEPRTEPDRKIKMPAGTSLFHVGPLQGKGERFVVRTTRAYLRLTPGEAPHMLAPGGPGLPARVANVLWRSLFTDLDRDGMPDFVDVSLKGYSIRYGNGRMIRLPPHLTERVDTTADAASDRLLARFAFAEWHDGNFNGDLRPDFALMTDTGLLVYTGDAHARFSPERSMEIKFPEAKDAELTLLDFNRDGQTDVLAVNKNAGKATVLVSDSRKGLTAARRIQLTVPGEMRNAIVSDFNGDGLQDLALPYVPKLTFQDILRVVARREVMIKVPLFLNKGGKRVFGPLADSRLSLPVRVRVRTDSVGRLRLGGLVVVEYEGDLNGDGRPDLLVTDTSTRLAIHPGVPGRVYREEPTAYIRIPDCAEFETVVSKALDLNGDKSSDIILHYRGAGRRPDRLYLLWSRKK